MFFVVKNNAVQYRSLWWVKSHEKIEFCDEGARSYDLQVEKVGAHTVIWKNLCANQRWSTLRLDRLIRKVDARLL